MIIVKATVLALCCIVGQNVIASIVKQKYSKKFQDDLMFGVATSAYQIEGAWNEDGKSMSIWDYLARTNASAVVDKATGDVACNSYHFYKRDIEMLKELGVSAYRFSMAWTRILPYGTDNYTNPLGVAYYNNLINELLANEIEPYVTMYHWDLPQSLSEQGGWLNPKIVDWFGNYARVLYSEFGDRVKNWVTLNEPNVHCILGFEYAMHAPLKKMPGIGYYQCGRNHILAHARAYHIYNDEGFGSIQNGRIGITLDIQWSEPASNSVEDKQAAQDFKTFMLRQYADMIYTDRGQYPQVMIDRVASISAKQGLSQSRLQPLTEEESNYVKNTANFLGINHYTTYQTYRNSSLTFSDFPSVKQDMNLNYFTDPSLSVNPKGWVADNAIGFYKLLHYLKEYYGNIPIFITENGYSTGKTLQDDDRATYYNNYLSALIDAKNEGVNIEGYFAWSLMDNFEWHAGYSVRFGIYDVDFDSENKTRTPKKSALVYKQMISTRSIDFSYDPDPTQTLL